MLDIDKIKHCLLSVTKSFYLEHQKTIESLNVVINEPYIPFIPNDWNGILILAESQNLSPRYREYVDWLRSRSFEEKLLRLYIKNKEAGKLGIMPWDDGTLKIAIEVAINSNPKETAVSNAILWSLVEKRRNKEPNQTLIELSIQLWHKFFECFKPKIIITSGKKAKIVMSNLKVDKQFNLISPSKTYLSRVSGIFEVNDLLNRYPEVMKLKKTKPFYFEGDTKNKVFFACHAVSMIKR